jgi:hypothetical protein
MHFANGDETLDLMNIGPQMQLKRRESFRLTSFRLIWLAP